MNTEDVMPKWKEERPLTAATLTHLARQGALAIDPSYTRFVHEFQHWAVRFVLFIISLQLITVAIITVSYWWRHRKNAPSGYRTIDLPSCEIQDGDVQIYMDGDSLFADMLAAIEAAESRILLETFIWKDDEIGRKIRDLCVEKARSGVEVYLIYDSIGNILFNRATPKFPRDIPTLHVARYFSFKRPRHLLSPSRYTVSHRKTLIIDDNIGFVGGYNIGDEYQTCWRDTHVRITGDGTQALVHAFVDFWNHYINHRHNKLPHASTQLSNTFSVIRNDPMRRNYPIRSMYLQAIEHAQKHIYITNAYFVPDRAVRLALVDAAARGVDVQIILPWESNHLMVDWIARHWFSHYLKAGVKLWGYDATMLHTKTMTIDSTWTTIGTTNLDRLSLWLNHEINVTVYDEAVAAQMEAVFVCDRQFTHRIEPEEWARRPIRYRFAERILAPLWPFV